MISNKPMVKKDEFSLFENSGEIGRLVIDHDWSKTSIGNIKDWPLSLRITLFCQLHDTVCFLSKTYFVVSMQVTRTPQILSSSPKAGL